MLRSEILFYQHVNFLKILFMILFNKKGQYVTHYVGMVPQEMIQSDIEQILGE